MLSHQCKVLIASTTAAGASGTSAITSDAIDTDGFHGCCILVPLGPITSGAATSVKLQQSSDNDQDDYSDITGTNQTIADDDDNKLKYIDIINPGKRYLKVVVSRATQAATIGGVFAILYNAGHTPVTHGTGVAGETFNNTAEGTA